MAKVQQPNGMNQLLNILKDKASLVKASLATKRDIYLIHKAIINATAESNTSPPTEYGVATIINLGHDTREVARACIEAIMDRLHNNGNPYVKLKCLIIIHNIIFKGTFILRDQLISIFSITGLVSRTNTPLLPIFTGRTFLNSEDIVADHHTDGDDDDSAANLHMGSMWPSERRDSETLELWKWVSWYSNVLERSLKTSMVLGCCFSSSTYTQFEKFKDTDGMNRSLEKDLLKEMDVLIFMIEEICGVPQLILDCSLVHEIVLLVTQEYVCLQYQIMMRLNEFSQRLERLSTSDSSELMSYLKRLKNCKKTLNQMYENRKRNDSFWELIYQTKIEIEQFEERREIERIKAEMEKIRKKKENERKRSAMEMMLLSPPPPPPPRQEASNEGGSVESTHSVGRVMRASRTLKFLACCGSRDVAVERVHLTASQALS